MKDEVLAELTGTPRQWERWMAAPGAEAVERWIPQASAAMIASTSFAIPAARASALSAMGAIAGAAPRTLRIASWMRSPAAEPAAILVHIASSEAPDAIPYVFGSRKPAANSSLAKLAAPPVFYGWKAVPAPQPAETWIRIASTETVAPLAFAPCAEPRLPLFALSAIDGPDEVLNVVPPACEEWMRAQSAEPVESRIDLAMAHALPAAIELRQPGAANVELTPTFVHRVSTLARAPQADAATSEIRLSIAGSPAAYDRRPSMLGFALYAADDVLAQPLEKIAQAGPGAPLPSLEASPVESMPSIPAFQAAPLAPAASTQLPEIACELRTAMRVAPAATGLRAIPVESMTAASQPALAFLDTTPALRAPTMARLRPADDMSEALGTRVASPGPVPVESMPAIPAFAPLPLQSPMDVVAQRFEPSMRVELSVPRVAGPAPNVSAPAAAAHKPGVVEPISRISAQPAGSQPERPKPAIPQPGLFALEYYCQPTAGTPAKRIDWLDPKIEVVFQPFTLRAALGQAEERRKKKPARMVLPFEEIFAQKKGKGNRLHISVIGKIAATIMVGLALWTGTRIAYVSQPSTGIKAQVSRSQRSVTVAGARVPDPSQANFGSGPMGKLRKAIAGRASTQVTDNFHAGMAAWGSGKQAWAPGWKHNSQGFVSTGDLALFEPSLKYTDYRMEFYGQIEQKSMGWVVRATDKKNYYAMKFTVVEPGLRPVIAMVHYGVVNGKVGHKIQTPLSVMVHNNKPIHVAVDVRGNKFTTSIDGERVDSWRDDSAAQGGVGFFSEAGEKARLYWVKLSRNQDWLGRFCAYLSDSGAEQTAELWGPEFPRERREPEQPKVPVLAMAIAGAAVDGSTGHFRIAKQHRS
jgi:hypothetical protein